MAGSSLEGKKNKNKKKRIKTTVDVLRILCEAIKITLKEATNSDIDYSSTFIKTTKTCLRPDVGCFVLFGGGFTGLVAMNFSAESALEIYKRYHLTMGIPEEELSNHHLSSEVADTMGELMNQSVGKFQRMLKSEFGIGVTQNQPKMVSLNQPMRISLEAEVDRPQYMRVEFKTQENNLFYLETTFEKVEFIVVSEPKNNEEIDIEKLLEGKTVECKGEQEENKKVDEEFLKKLGL